MADNLYHQKCNTNRGINVDRTEVMIGYLRPYLVNRIQMKIAECKMIEEETLLSKMKTMLQNALVRQSENTEWKPAYMGVFHLLTSLLTEEHEFEIIIADNQLYLDELKIVGEWTPSFIYKNEQELELLKRQLQHKFSRLNDYEVDYIKRWVFYEYRNLIGIYWKNRIGTILSTKEYKRLDKSVPFSFLFGDYMGTMHIILKDEKEGI